MYVPDQDGAEEDQACVVRLALLQCCAGGPALAEDESVGQRRPA